MRRMNRYAQMRRHKRKLKEKYGRGGPFSGCRTNLKLHEDEYRRENVNNPYARNGGYRYWQTFYITGPRRFAKVSTNRAIRAMYRDMLNTIDPEDMDDVQALNGADYEKMFDYAWTIW